MNGNKKGGTSWKKWIASIIWLDECAGGICIRERKGKTEILCVIHPDGGVMLPKGRVKRGESLENAALREFREETGIYASSIGEKIGIVRDRKRGKKITLYWIHQSGGQHTPMHDEAIMWVNTEEALKKMKHKSERDFIEKYIV